MLLIKLFHRFAAASIALYPISDTKEPTLSNTLDSQLQTSPGKSLSLSLMVRKNPETASHALFCISVDHASTFAITLSSQFQTSPGSWESCCTMLLKKLEIISVARFCISADHFRTLVRTSVSQFQNSPGNSFSLSMMMVKKFSRAAFAVSQISVAHVFTRSNRSEKISPQEVTIASRMERIPAKIACKMLAPSPIQSVARMPSIKAPTNCGIAAISCGMA